MFQNNLVSMKRVGWDSAVSIATCYGLDSPGIESQWGWDFPHLPRPALRPTQTPIQWVPGLWLEHGIDHPPPFAMTNRIFNSKRFQKFVIFSYAGHGSGTQFLKVNNIQKVNVRAVTFLFGCSSVTSKDLGGWVERAGIWQVSECLFR